MKKIFLVTFLALLFFFLFAGNQIFAACPTGIVPCGTSDCPCTFCHFFELIHNIINFLIIPCPLNNDFPLIPTVAGLMLIIGGLYLLVSGANPETFSKAKSIITATIIGLVIIFIAWVFLNTFLDYIGVAKWTGLRDNPDTPQEEGWWQIDCGH